jgi:hypothetical protein
MSNPIVNVVVSLQVAPAPSTLQKQGAFISQGATNTSPGTKSLLAQYGDLAPILKGALSLTGISQSGGLATAVAAAAHGFPIGDVIDLTIFGANQAAYNGAQLCTITTTTHFTFVVPSGTTSPATGTIVYSPEDVGELVQMATTFFAQGRAQAVTVLELGAGSVADGVVFLTAWIAQNPKTFYSYLVPRYWDSDPSFLAMLANFNATDALTYFFVTSTLQNWTNYQATMKCVDLMIEAPNYSVWPANVLTAIAYSAAWGVNVLTAIAWSAAGGGTVTAATTSDHGVQPGQLFSISGCTPAGYNGSFIALPGTTAEALIYALATNPGAETVLGDLDASAGGTVTASTTTNHGIAVGQSFQIAGCLPAGYNGTFVAIEGTTGETLVYAVPAALGAESLLGTLVMSQYASAGVPSTEFSHAADFWVTLNYKPSSSNKVTPLNFSYLFGVTPFQTEGNAAILSELNAAGVNVVGTGAQGGISATLLIGGETMDGNPFNYWYSIDWAQINLARNVTAYLINGSNNPVNPVYYNQPGINGLQQVGVSTMNTGITNGLVLFPVKPTTLAAPDYVAALDADTYVGYTVVNAEPFIAYSTENPNDYKAGIYDGMSVEYTPLRGFDSITINVAVSNFVTG